MPDYYNTWNQKFLQEKNVSQKSSIFEKVEKFWFWTASLRFWRKTTPNFPLTWHLKPRVFCKLGMLPKFPQFLKNIKIRFFSVQFYHLSAKRIKQFFKIFCWLQRNCKWKHSLRNLPLEKYKNIHFRGNHFRGKRRKNVFSYFPMNLCLFYQTFLQEENFSKKSSVFGKIHSLNGILLFWCRSILKISPNFMLPRRFKPKVLANWECFKKFGLV